MTVCLQYSLKLGSLIPPAPFFFLNIYLAIHGLLCFHANWKIFCFNYVKNVIGNFIRIALKLQITLGSIVIFTILILPIQEHGISLHLFVSSLISFISILQFSEYRSFASLGRFIPSYFILFDAMVNGIVFIISLYDRLLLVYRNARDFCVLIFYPATLPNSLISSSSFPVASLGLSMYSIMSSAKRDRFTSSFPIQIPFISFSSLIGMARTSKTMLNKSGESGHLCLVPDFGGNAFSSSPLKMMFAVGLLYMAYIMLRQVPSMFAIRRVFITNGC